MRWFRESTRNHKDRGMMTRRWASYAYLALGATAEAAEYRALCAGATFAGRTDTISQGSEQGQSRVRAGSDPGVRPRVPTARPAPARLRANSETRPRHLIRDRSS